MTWNKNVSITGFTFGMLNKSNGSPITTGTVSGYVTINGGTQTALIDTPHHEGNGQWSVDLNASEMNGEIIGLAFVHDNAVPCYFTIKTESGGSSMSIITVNDSAASPIQDVAVHVYNSDNSVFITGGISDTSGIVSFALADGTYKVRMRKAGVSFTVPETLTVSGDTSTVFEGYVASIGEPIDSDACRVYEYCYNQAGDMPLPSITGTATITSLPYNYDNKLHSSSAVTGIYDPVTGLVYWDIVKLAKVNFIITEIGFSKKKIIPNLTTARLSDIT